MNDSEQTEQESLSFKESILSIYQNDGIQGFWKGLGAGLVLCINPAITYGVFERLKQIWIEKLNVKRLNSLQIFIIGAIAKTLATIVSCNSYSIP